MTLNCRITLACKHWTIIQLDSSYWKRNSKTDILVFPLHIFKAYSTKADECYCLLPVTFNCFYNIHPPTKNRNLTTNLIVPTNATKHNITCAKYRYRCIAICLNDPPLLSGMCVSGGVSCWFSLWTELSCRKLCDYYDSKLDDIGCCWDKDEVD